MYEGAVYSPKLGRKKKNRKRTGTLKHWGWMAVTLGVAGSVELSVFFVEHLMGKGYQPVPVRKEQAVYSQAGEVSYEKLVIKQGESSLVRDSVVWEEVEEGQRLQREETVLSSEQQMEVQSVEDSLVLEEAGEVQEGQRLQNEAIVLSQKQQMDSQLIGEIEEEKESKIMYLTFDDGPDPESTGRILDILKERNIKATFFVIGENVRRYPEMARRIVAEGHTIGIHCNNHNYDTLYKSVDSYLRDFEAAYAAVKEVTGVEVWLFRFPGGSINAYNQWVNRQIAEEMENRGFVYYDWNASLEDAVKDPVREELVANALETPLGRKRVVMLAHDTVDMTADCLEEILDRLSEYRMEVLTREVKPIQFRLR